MHTRFPFMFDTRSSFCRRVSGALLAALVLLGACRSEPPNIGVTVSDVADDPEEYYGQIVTVSGEVDRIYGPTIFSIGGDDFDDDLLVISVDSVAPGAGRVTERPFVEEDIVQVTGLVHPFVEAEIEAEYSLDLDPQLEIEFETQPVIVASSAAALLSDVIVTPRSTSTAGLPTEAVPVTTVDDVVQAEAPDALVDRLAVFTNAEIQDVLTENALWVGPDSTRRVFVVVPEMALEDVPRPGEQWLLHGVLTELPGATVLRTWGMDEETVAALAEHHVYLRAVRAERTGGP